MEAPVRLVPEWRAKPRARRESPIAPEDPVPVVPDPRVDPRGYEAFYHDHAEEWCMPSRLHGDLATQLRNQFGRMAPHCWVAMELNTYWIENQNRIYLRPDVIVGWPPEPDLQAQSHRTWDHGLVALVAEIASEESRARDLYTKVSDYAEGVQPHEYLYYDPHNDHLALYRQTPTGYVVVPHAANGWVWSEAVGCWFGVRAHGWLGVYDAEGCAVPDYGEFASRAETEAVARIAAEQQAAAEAVARIAAEQQAAAQAVARIAAEQQAAAEAVARITAEQQAAAEAVTRITAEEQAETEAVARAAAEQQAAAEAAARTAAERQAKMAEQRAESEAAARVAAEAEAAALREQLAAVLRNPRA